MITNKEIKKSLNNLRVLEPDQGFKSASKAFILSQAPERRAAPLRLPFLQIAGAFATLILVVSILTIELTPTPVLSSSFNPDYLQNEFETLVVNVQIEEVEYRKEANATIASALNEIENTEVKHLNNSRLQGEAENIRLEDSTNPQIDSMLETVIF
jgi:hypothetical protein